MASPDPIHLLRQAIASHQGLGITAPEVVVGAQCVYEVLPHLMEIITFRRSGYVSIYVGKGGKYDRVEWHQVKFAS